MKAFVYLWVNSKNKMMYIGVHSGHENDGYISSSSTLQAAMVRSMSSFKRIILSRGDHTVMRDLEQALLEVFNARASSQFYNGRKETSVKPLTMYSTKQIRRHARLLVRRIRTRK